jgi:hypothetical protein
MATTATANAPVTLRLKLRIVATVDFRHGVPFHYESLKKRRLLRDIEEDETVLLVSQTGRQLAFVFNEVTIESRGGDPVAAISHFRVQLGKHTPFNGKMLSEYAAKAHIELVGIKRFEDHLTAGAA